MEKTGGSVMNLSGWVTMILSVSGVTLFFAYTLIKVLRIESAKKKLHSTLDETPDTKEDR